MKHGSTTTHLKQKDRHLSEQQLVKAVQSDQKLNSELARLWRPYFGTRIILSAEIKKKRPHMQKKKVLCHKSIKTMVNYERKDESFYKKGIEKLGKRWNECIALEGNCVDE